jgi:hypothetical protein
LAPDKTLVTANLAKLTTYSNQSSHIIGYNRFLIGQIWSVGPDVEGLL